MSSQNSARDNLVNAEDSVSASTRERQSLRIASRALARCFASAGSATNAELDSSSDTIWSSDLMTDYRHAHGCGGLRTVCLGHSRISARPTWPARTQGAASVTSRHVLEPLHLFAVRIHDPLHLLPAQRLAPLVCTSLEEEPRLFIHCFHEAVFLFERR